MKRRSDRPTAPLLDQGDRFGEGEGVRLVELEATGGHPRVAHHAGQQRVDQRLQQEVGARLGDLLEAAAEPVVIDGVAQAVGFGGAPRVVAQL